MGIYMFDSNWTTEWILFKGNIVFRIDLRYYDVGSMLPTHTDGGEYGHKAYRLNIVLQRAKKGGRFTGKTIFNICDRVFFFRPDIHPHGVSAVEEGTREVLIFTLFTHYGKAIENEGSTF